MVCEECEGASYYFAFAQGLLLEGIVRPVGVYRGGGSYEGEVIAAEGAVMFSGLPDVDIGFEEGDSKREPVAAERLREGNDVGLDFVGFKAKESTGSAAARLDVINNEENAPSFADAGKPLKPPASGSINASLTLNGFDNDGSG